MSVIPKLVIRKRARALIKWAESVSYINIRLAVVKDLGLLEEEICVYVKYSIKGKGVKRRICDLLIEGRGLYNLYELETKS